MQWLAVIDLCIFSAAEGRLAGAAFSSITEKPQISQGELGVAGRNSVMRRGRVWVLMGSPMR